MVKTIDNNTKGAGSLQFALIVNTSVVKSYSALKFAEAVINLKHSIQTIFFYQQGVSVANACIDLPQDEINIQQNWQTLAKQQAIKLVVCSSSALRQGIPLDKLADQFIIGSLGQLTEIISAADRVIMF